MSANIKGINIEIGGEVKPLNKALKDVNDTSYSLQGELNKVNKLLKFDPKNTELLAQKQKLLGDQINNTKEKLDRLKGAQAQVNEQFKKGQINEQQYRAFQREIAETENKLKNLRKQGLEPTIEKLKKVGEVSEKVAKGGLKTVGTAVGVAGKAFKAYIGVVTAAGTAMFGLSAKAAATADELNTLAKQTGLPTAELQKMKYASELIDVPLETITGSMAKLTRNMYTAQKGTGEQAKAFQALGVSVVNSNGELRNNQEVFEESIKALGKMENATQRDAYAMQLFGKSAQDLNPLIMGGAEQLRKLGEQAEKAGLIMSQEALDDLNSFSDSLDTLKANAGGAGNILGSTFAGGFKGITDVVGANLPDLAKSISDIFKGIDKESAVLELTESLTEIVTTALDTLVENLPAFLEMVNALLLSLVDALSTAIPKIVDDVLPALLKGFNSLLLALVKAIPKILPKLVEGAFALFLGLLDGLNEAIPALMAELPTMLQKVLDTIIANLPLIIEGGIQLIASLIIGIAQALPTLIPAVIDAVLVIVMALLDNIDLLIDAGIELIIGLSVGLIEAIPIIIEKIPIIIMKLVGALIEALPQLLEGGVKLIVEVGKGLIKGIPTLIANIPQVITSMLEALAGSLIKFTEVGKDIVKGLWEGIKSMGDWIKDKVGGFFGGIVDGVKGLLGIHSPSKVFAGIGGFMAEGLGDGFTDEMKSIQKDIDKAIPTSFAPSKINVTGEANIASNAGGQAKQPLTIIMQYRDMVLGKAVIADINSIARANGTSPIFV